MTVVELVERERSRLRLMDLTATVAILLVVTLAIVSGGAWLLGNARWLALPRATPALVWTTLALANGTPVCTMGEAIYDLPGLTHQGHLDSFWANPVAPEPGVYPAFRRVLVDRCLTEVYRTDDRRHVLYRDRRCGRSADTAIIVICRDADRV